MSERVRLKPKEESKEDASYGLYFAGAKPHLELVSTGCTLLDCALGGGFCLGRIANIIGDKSTCKTLLASETATNFLLKYPEGRVFYRESEAAFDRNYAKAMGFPVEKMDFVDGADFYTVEDYARDLEAQVEEINKAKVPGLYALDSLDALSDESELEAEIGEGRYGTAKAKQMSLIFRKNVQKIEHSRMCELIISQERDNIGVSFGRKSTRSGGRALDFYATHIIWLARVKTIEKVIKNIKRPIGVTIKAYVEKNKIGLERRSVEFDFLYGFGVDNLTSNLDWIKDVKRYDALHLKDEKELVQYRKLVSGMKDEDYYAEVEKINDVVRNLWIEIEQDFLPTRRKYQ